MVGTPVSAALTAAKWLWTVISPLPSKPSADLWRFLTLCDGNVASDLMHRAQVILQAIFPSSALGDCRVAGSSQNAELMAKLLAEAEQRRMEALKLYYRILEAICRTELQTTKPSNLTRLLTNERFHRSMLACSSELVLAAHKMVTLLFPYVLERIGITAFDLSKVIESFVRHEESLPKELRRHLNCLEERLLEDMVWQKGSSMYNSLIVVKPALSKEIYRLELLAEPMPSLDSVSMQNKFSCGGLPLVRSLQKQGASHGQNDYARSPKRQRKEHKELLVERNSFMSSMEEQFLALNNHETKPPTPLFLQCAFPSQTKIYSRDQEQTGAEAGINLLLCKVIKLSAVRIGSMTERLQLSSETRESIYRLFQKILNQQLSIFFNRHIDQIILCCFYVVAKVSRLNLTFTEIMENYRNQSGYSPHVLQSVFVASSLLSCSQRLRQKYVHIVKFYNEIFIPTVKPLLRELDLNIKSSQDSEAPCPGTPEMLPFPRIPDVSSKKVSAAHHVYVAPMRLTKMDVLLSLTPRSYFACVGQSTRAYQSPSKDLTAINNCLNANPKCRAKLNFDGTDAGKDLSLQNGTG